MISWFFTIISDNIKNLRPILCLARKDIKRAHMKSDLGWFWAIAKPLFYILMFYFAISTVGNFSSLYLAIFSLAMPWFCMK